MLKKSLAIFLSTALALGILVQGSFAYSKGQDTDIVSLVNSINLHQSAGDLHSVLLAYIKAHGSDMEGYQYIFCSCASNLNSFYTFQSDGMMYQAGNRYIYSTSSNNIYMAYLGNNRLDVPTFTLTWDNTTTTSSGITFYRFRYPYDIATIPNDIWYANYSIKTDLVDLLLLSNLDATGYVYNPDTRYLDAYITMSTYGKVKYLCVESDDVILSSTWLSIRYVDTYGSGTYIADPPFDYFTANGHSYIKIMPDLISDYEFTVTSVLYNGSSSWGTKEINGLDLTFNESVLPSPVPSAYPIPDYSYYDTTYINYNGGNPEVIYTPISSQLTIGFLGSDTSKYYFLDEFPFLYLEQPFSYTFIVIPDIPYEYSSFLEDSIYQYDIVIDDFEITNDNYSQVYSFDYVYGSGAWSNLNGLLTAAQVSDVSSVLDSWYSTHDPIVYQFPYHTSEPFSFDDRVYDCSLIVTDSFYFKQTNYLLGDTGDILSEFSDRFFKIDGFSDSLFDNISSLYNLNLQYFDSSLDTLTGLSYWLNDNDISSNLSDISDLLSSVDSYLSSVDGKLNYLVTIDSDLNDLLEWFQNQEDSDVTLTLPDFNPSILIDYYGENIGDFVEFVQEFVNTLPSFDYSDFPNFFDYAADLVDDTAGQSDDLIGSLFQPYDYDDSGLHEFGWD